MTEATKGIGQKDIEGATKNFFFLSVGSPKRGWQKLLLIFCAERIGIVKTNIKGF